MKKAKLKEIREKGGFSIFRTDEEVKRDRLKGMLNINHSAGEIIESAHRIILTMDYNLREDDYKFTTLQLTQLGRLLKVITDNITVITQEVRTNKCEW